MMLKINANNEPLIPSNKDRSMIKIKFKIYVKIKKSFINKDIIESMAMRIIERI